MNNGIVSPNQIKYSDESGSGTVIPLFDDPFKSSDSQLQINVSLPYYFQVGEININNANDSNIGTFTITAELTNGTVIEIQCEHGSFNVSIFFSIKIEHRTSYSRNTASVSSCDNADAGEDGVII